MTFFLSDKEKLFKSWKKRFLLKRREKNFNNPFYVEAKRHRLSSSKFGSVCKMTKISSATGIVESILYGKNLSSVFAVQFGVMNEERARRKYEDVYGVQVTESGLCTNERHPLLAASPDGFVGQHGIIEIKCLESVKES